MTSDSQQTSTGREIDLGSDAERLESLAALLDGDLEAGRRAEILASLDADDLDLLSEVDALMGECAEVSFDDEDIGAGDDANDEGFQGSEPRASEAPDSEMPDNVVRGPWSRRAWATVTTIAAVVALAVIAPRLFLPEPPSPQLVVGALDLAELTVEPSRQLPWSPQRGGSGLGTLGDVLSPRDSFRLGVLATDLEAAARSGNIQGLVDLRPWLQQVTGDSLLGIPYSSLTELQPGEALAQHEALQESVLRWVDPFSYRYGLWIRAAWLAAESGELNFFQGASARALGGLEPPDETHAEEIRALRQRIRGLRNAGDLPELATDLAEIADEYAG